PARSSRRCRSARRNAVASAGSRRAFRLVSRPSRGIPIAARSPDDRPGWVVTATMERYVPVDPNGTSHASESSTGFMLRCLLQSRLDAGLPSDDDGSEHDVHVYLAHLLGAYADPSYCVRIGSVISPNDTTVFETAQHSTSKRFRYRVYRINADHLMM